MTSQIRGKITSCISRLLVFLGLIYVVPLAIYLLQRWALSASTWWLEIADTFTLYLFVPTLLLLLLGLLTWSRPLLVLSIFPVAAFAMLYGGLFLPKSQKPVATEETFAVMTYNVLGMNRNFIGMMHLFSAEDPDIIAIQELAPEIAEGLSIRLAGKYQYKALAPRADFGGVGVFSRFPITEEDLFRATTNSGVSQHVILDVNGHEVHLFNLHPDHPHVRGMTRSGSSQNVVRHFDTVGQTAQVEAMMQRVETVEAPVIVLGDFNLTDQTRQYRRIVASLTDSHREAGWGFGHTFPANGRFYGIPLPYAVIRIDYVFHSEELSALEAHLGDNAGSDHFPLIVRLEFKVDR